METQFSIQEFNCDNTIGYYMKTTIKFAGYQGEQSVHTRAANRFCEALRRMAGELGDVGAAIDIQFEQNITQNGCKAADLLTRTENGELDGCYFSSSYLADRVPELGLFDQHFAVPDRRHAYAILDGALGRRLATVVEQTTGFTILAYWDNGLRHISSATGAIRHPRDCQGLKIRTLKNEQHQRVFRALGFDPVVIDVRDLPEAVESGKVDAQENPLTNIYNFGLHKTHRHLTLTQHILGVAPVLFNKHSVAAWPEPVRLAVRRALSEATVEQRRFAEEDDTLCFEALAADGCEIVTLSEKERAEFSAATDDVVGQFRSRFKPELIELFNADLASVNV